MANNYQTSGDRMPYTAGGTIASGAGVVVGSLLGVALGALTSGVRGVLALEGVFRMPKLSTAVIGQGALLTWDVSAGQFIIADAEAGDLEACAVAWEAAGNGATTVLARLCPGSGAVVVGDA